MTTTHTITTAPIGRARSASPSLGGVPALAGSMPQAHASDLATVASAADQYGFHATVGATNPWLGGSGVGAGLCATTAVDSFKRIHPGRLGAVT